MRMPTEYSDQLWTLSSSMKAWSKLPIFGAGARTDQRVGGQQREA